MPPTKARSRLKHSQAAVKIKAKSRLKPLPNKEVKRIQLPDKQKNADRQRLKPLRPLSVQHGSASALIRLFQLFKQQFQLRLKYGLALLLALLAYYSLYWLISNFYPEQLQDVLLENAYLPVFTLLFLANYLFFSFLFLKQEPALLLSFLLNFYLFLRLQKVNFDLFTYLLIVILFSVLALWLYLPLAKHKLISSTKKKRSGIAG